MERMPGVVRSTYEDQKTAKMAQYYLYKDSILREILAEGVVVALEPGVVVAANYSIRIRQL